MKLLEKYVCLVDNHRRPSRCRNTQGRYIVCAKSEKEAKELLQKKIGFGSVQVYYKIDKNSYSYENNLKLNYKDIVKVESDYTFSEAKHSTEKIINDVER